MGIIKLIKSSFYKEDETKEKLINFISSTNKLSMGEKCAEFEKEFSKYQGRTNSILYNSGSSANLALIQALINLGLLNKEDKVGFSAVTWATNVAPLLQLGLNPIPIDVSLNHLNVTSQTLLDTLSKENIKVLFLTNLLGLSGDIDNIKEICDKRKIILIEDNCEALGSEIASKKLGNFGLASTFSFFVGHHMSTIEGGMVCTDNSELADMLKMVRAHGWSRELSNEKQEKLKKQHNIKPFFDKYAFYTLGFNLRPTEITGFLGLEGLKTITEVTNKRYENFKAMYEVACKNPKFLKLDFSHMELVSNFAYPLLFDDINHFEEYKNKFIQIAEIRPIVAGSMVEQPFFKEYLTKNNLSYNCPNANKVHVLGFYLPNNPELNNKEINLFLKLLNGSDPKDFLDLELNNNTKKRALITGITGQDGSYLAEFLLKKGYEVHGLVRRTSSLNRSRLDSIYKYAVGGINPNLTLHYGDMGDSSSLIRILSMIRPHEIYNLAAQSHVQVSFEIPEYTGESDALGVLKILEAMKQLKLNNTKLYQASTSELFGASKEVPKNEMTLFYPRSPYGVAKLYAYWIIKNYREAYNVFACNGILFNHESPRRGENFVSKKITKSVAEIKYGIRNKLILGNLDAIRDWGYAPDYVEAMWLMLQQDKPIDYVIATGEGHTVREFVEESFKEIGINLKWTGEGVNEKGIDYITGKVLVEIDPKYFRPTEVDILIGDYSKAKKELGWSPKTTFKTLVKVMMEHDLKETHEKILKEKSLEFFNSVNLKNNSEN